MGGGIIIPFGVGIDKSDLLDDIIAIIKQDNVEITSSTGLDPKKEIDVNVSFIFPVTGDFETDVDESLYIKSGDFAYIPLPESFKLMGSVQAELYYEGDKVADLEIITDPLDSKQKAKVTFTDTVDDKGIKNVGANFSMRLKFDGDNEDESDKELDVTIYDKQFKLTLPAKKTEITSLKEGKADIVNGVINWVVKVNANRTGGVNDDGVIDDGSLDGYTFSDILTDTNGGSYNNQFKITTDKEGTNIVVSSGETYDTVSKELSYTFTGDTPADEEWIGTRYIHFQTNIPENKYYENGNVTVGNTAYIKKGVNVVSTATGNASFILKWIEKEGLVVGTGLDESETYDPSNRQIKWTIYLEGKMSDAYLDDTLQSGLSYVSATVKKHDGTDYNEDVSHTVVPTSLDDKTKLTIGLGNISGKYKVEIVTRVTNVANANKEIPYNNSATIRGTEKPGGIVSNNYGVTIGVPSIRKSAGTYDVQNHKMTWNVTVDTKKQELGGGLRVLDLLVYGTSIDIDNIDMVGSKIGNEGNLNDVSETTLKNITRHYNQKIDTTSFNMGSTDLEYKIHTLTIGGVAVADLLVVTGVGGISIDHTKVHNFTYKTIVTNPNFYASNDRNNIYNRAHLLSNDIELNESGSSYQISSNMLNKDILNREDAKKVSEASDVSDASISSLVDKTEGGEDSYDYIDKSVIYRIRVNPNGIDITNGDTAIIGEIIGNYKIKDSLPKGWEFEKINGNSDFLLYEINGSIKNYISDYSSILEETPQPTATASDAFGQEMTFDFKNLTKSYIILVKAGPTEDTVKDYLSEIKDYTENNKIELIDNDKVTVLVNDDTDVIIENSIITKDVNRSFEGQDYLIWTIDYRPYEIDYPNSYIKDILDVGIDLRTDANGQLVIKEADGTENIRVVELTLNNDGKYEEGSALLLPDKDIINYDNASRTLYFYPPEKDKSYRLVYYTDITGDGSNIHNTVEFISSSVNPLSTFQSFSIASYTSGAIFERSGWFEITKTDGSTDLPLPGVKFILYSTSGVVIREGITNSNGILTMKALPDGDYILKEIEVVGNEYNISDREYKVHVEKVLGKPVTSIDGSVTSNIDIKNYKKGIVGSLLIEKEVLGNDVDVDKKFRFQFILRDSSDVIEDTSEYSYNLLDKYGRTLETGKIKSSDFFEISSKEEFKIFDLPKDSKYTVIEDDYTSDGYVSTVSGGSNKVNAP